MLFSKSLSLSGMTSHIFSLFFYNVPNYQMKLQYVKNRVKFIYMFVKEVRYDNTAGSPEKGVIFIK